MPRTPRQQSATEIYHVFMRGINRQAIFEEEDDFLRFKTALSKAKERCGFELYGYCLMSNHCHLLLRTQGEDIGQSIKRIATAYAAWFNRKYDRTGHLFQGRFGSEAIETDDYLLAVLRYIHQNPLRAGLGKRPEHYEWSSYLDYMGAANSLADTAFVRGLASSYSDNWMEWFVEYTDAENSDSFIDCEALPRLTDDLLRSRIKDLYGLKAATGMSALEKQQRNRGIHLLKEEGFGLRQISRVTGIPYGIVRGL